MAIGNALESNTTLTSLDLEFNQIGEKALGGKEAITSNTTLQKLPPVVMRLT